MASSCAQIRIQTNKNLLRKRTYASIKTNGIQMHATYSSKRRLATRYRWCVLASRIFVRTYPDLRANLLLQLLDLTLYLSTGIASCEVRCAR